MLPIGTINLPPTPDCPGSRSPGVPGGAPARGWHKRGYDVDQSGSVRGTALWARLLRPGGTRRRAGFHPPRSRYPRTKGGGSMGSPSRGGWKSTTQSTKRFAAGQANGRLASKQPAQGQGPGLTVTTGRCQVTFGETPSTTSNVFRECDSPPREIFPIFA